MPVMEISVVPLGTRTPSVGTYVARALEVLMREKNIAYSLTPMGTVVEAGSIGKLLDIARRMHQSVFSGRLKRVVTTIKIDDRRDKKLTMKGKMMSVSKELKMNKNPALKMK